MKLIFKAFIVVIACGLFATDARAQDDLLQHDSRGRLVDGASACVGPFAPSDADGVQILGSTTAAEPLTWQVWSTSSQTAPAIVFTQSSTTVDAVVPPSGNLLYYACVTDGPIAGQRYSLTLKSAQTGDPQDTEDIRQERVFGDIAADMFACTGKSEPSDDSGVHIFGFTNGAEELTWTVLSFDEDSNRVVELSTRSTFVNEVIPPIDGLTYVACVGGGPNVVQDFDVVLNSTRLE